MAWSSLGRGALRAVASVRCLHATTPLEALRGPKRYFGWTRARYLDFFMSTNARICFFTTVTAIPMGVFATFQYFTVQKPKVQEQVLQVETELLAEGKAPL